MTNYPGDRRGRIHRLQQRAGDVKHSQADISRAREALDYRPRVSLEEGLRGAVSWHLAQRQATARARGATGAQSAHPSRAARPPTYA